MDCTSASPQCAAQLVAKAERRAAEVSGIGSDAGGPGPLCARARIIIRMGWVTKRGPR